LLAHCFLVRLTAIIFAVSLTVNVPCWTMFPIVLAQTTSGSSATGVPWGTRCSDIWFVLNLTHNGNFKCVVLVKI
jgi:hypothetical protein